MECIHDDKFISWCPKLRFNFKYAAQVSVLTSSRATVRETCPQKRDCENPGDSERHLGTSYTFLSSLSSTIIQFSLVRLSAGHSPRFLVFFSSCFLIFFSLRFSSLRSTTMLKVSRLHSLKSSPHFSLQASSWSST